MNLLLCVLLFSIAEYVFLHAKQILTEGEVMLEPDGFCKHLLCSFFSPRVSCFNCIE